MRRRYRITWTETHEQDVWADSEQEACDLADMNIDQETYVHGFITEAEAKEEAEPDDMGIAKAERESAA